MFIYVYLLANKLIDSGEEAVTEDDAGHGCGEPELLLEVFGAERDTAVDEDGIARAVEHREHERTVAHQRLGRLHHALQCSPTPLAH